MFANISSSTRLNDLMQLKITATRFLVLGLIMGLTHLSIVVWHSNASYFELSEERTLNLEEEDALTATALSGDCHPPQAEVWMSPCSHFLNGNYSGALIAVENPPPERHT